MFESDFFLKNMDLVCIFMLSSSSIMKTYKPLIIATLLFISCQNHKTSNQYQIIDSDSTKQSGLIDTSHNKASSELKDFSNFWKQFRTSVLNFDTTQIITMTQFPFRVRGNFDDDPIVKCNRKKFIPMFQAFLKQGSGLGETTELDEIKKTIIPNNKDVNGGYARISDLVFEKNDKGWNFTFAYLDYSIIDSLKK
jgi:hypothetical protein